MISKLWTLILKQSEISELLSDIRIVKKKHKNCRDVDQQQSGLTEETCTYGIEPMQKDFNSHEKRLKQDILSTRIGAGYVCTLCFPATWSKHTR